MLKEIRIYFEGDKSLRSGFAAFFSEIRDRGKDKRCKVVFIATEGTPDRDFDIGKKANASAWNILLRDSEGPHNPALAVSDSKFWMVEMMESWFHADKDALEAFYGRGFKREALKNHPNVEQIPKQDLVNGLKAATKDSRKGDYTRNKTNHGPELLAQIKPVLVRKAAPNCERMFKTILDKLH